MWLQSEDEAKVFATTVDGLSKLMFQLIGCVKSGAANIVQLINKQQDEQVQAAEKAGTNTRLAEGGVEAEKGRIGKGQRCIQTISFVQDFVSG